MKWLHRAVALALLTITASYAEEKAPASFAPLEQWKAAVMAGDKATLAQFYATRPPAKILVGKGNVESLNNELQFWAGLTSAGVTKFNPKVLSIETVGNQAKLVLRVQAVHANQPIFASMAQIWVQQLDGWHLALSQRSDFYADTGRRLPEPAKPNPVLYPDPSQAQAQLTAALAEAGRKQKRVLVVFGANWCYDCHVLDTTFHSPAFASLVQANYVVVHINTGDEGKDNNDLAAQLGVNLDRGVPSLAVLDPDGKVIVSQRNGEFESTVKIGPEDVHAFLEKWKPTRK
jgi:thiol-disulfide isomerase/thioredoxin